MTTLVLIKHMCQLSFHNMYHDWIISPSTFFKGEGEKGCNIVVNIVINKAIRCVVVNRFIFMFSNFYGLDLHKKDFYHIGKSTMKHQQKPDGKSNLPYLVTIIAQLLTP